jgi:cysteinyl-tRNA synthetase
VKEFIFHLQTGKLEEGSDPEIATLLAESRAQFEAGLDDDLNSAQALAAVFELVRRCNIAMSKGTLRTENRNEILQWFKIVDDRLAIIPALEQLTQADQEIEGLIALRNEARRNRDFAQSDEIRQRLLILGVLIEDTREGTKWRRR